MHKNILFDTDIGTDIDDALALVMLKASKKINLIGVSTVYGPSLVRAKVALTLLDALGDQTTPVIAGDEETLSGNTVWLSGKEADMVASSLKPIKHSLVEFVDKQFENLLIVATGPLTNVARLIDSSKTKKKIQSLVIMGGVLADPGLPRFEHNFAADPIAAKKVIESDIPVILVPLNLTSQFQLTDEELKSLSIVQSPSGKLIARWLNNWLETTRSLPKNNFFYNTVFLHDPIAVAVAQQMPCKKKIMSVVVDAKNGEVLLDKRGQKIKVVTGVENQLVEEVKITIIEYLRNSL